MNLHTSDGKNLNLKELPDGSGRVCVHWLVEDPQGPIRTQGVIGATLRGSEFNPLGSRRWRIACNPKQNSINPQTRGKETLVCSSSDDIRAVSCPKCQAMPEAIELMDRVLKADTEMSEASKKVVDEAQKNHEKTLVNA